jgi:hypothetical protein
MNSPAHHSSYSSGVGRSGIYVVIFGFFAFALVLLFLWLAPSPIVDHAPVVVTTSPISAAQASLISPAPNPPIPAPKPVMPPPPRQELGDPLRLPRVPSSTNQTQGAPTP